MIYLISSCFLVFWFLPIVISNSPLPHILMRGSSCPILFEWLLRLDLKRERAFKQCTRSYSTYTSCNNVQSILPATIFTTASDTPDVLEPQLDYLAVKRVVFYYYYARASLLRSIVGYSKSSVFARYLLRYVLQRAPPLAQELRCGGEEFW